MDIATGLSLLAQATGIVKNLREIDKSFDVATMKSQMADLYSTLADIKIALSDARKTIHERDHQIRDLEGKFAALTSGEACPLCTIGKMKIAASREHPHFGFAGVQERTLKCDQCGHSEKRLHDPDGRSKSK